MRRKKVKNIRSTKLVLTLIILIAAAFAIAVKEGVVAYLTEYTESAILGDTLEVNPKALVKLQGEITNKSLVVTQQILALAESGEPEIYVLLNGPGGTTTTSYQIIQSLNMARNRGIKVSCAVTSLAASAHFNILALGCDERYVFPMTRLMFHGVRYENITFSLGTEDLFSKTALSLEKENVEVINQLCAVMLPAMESCEKMIPPFLEEKRWSVDELQKFTKPGFLKIIKDIKGAGTNIFLKY